MNLRRRWTLLYGYWILSTHSSWMHFLKKYGTTRCIVTKITTDLLSHFFLPLRRYISQNSRRWRKKTHFSSWRGKYFQQKHSWGLIRTSTKLLKRMSLYCTEIVPLRKYSWIRLLNLLPDSPGLIDGHRILSASWWRLGRMRNVDFHGISYCTTLTTVSRAESAAYV